MAGLCPAMMIHGAGPTFPSCPALCRASTSFRRRGEKDVDGRVIGGRKHAVLRTAMPGHDRREAIHHPLVIPGRRASAGPGIQTQARSVFLDSGFAHSARPGMTTYSIVKQHGRAASPVFFCGAGYAVVSFCPPQRRGRWRARWRNHCLFCAALPLERRGRLMARHRGRLPYSAGPRFTGAVRFSPPAFAFCGEAHGGRSAPAGHAPGGRLVVAAGRSSRRRPGAGEAFSPGRGRRIRSHPHDAS